MKLLMAILLGMTLMGLAQAQERTATSSMDSEMTWSQLKNSVNAININTAAADKRVDQIVVCGKKKMVYAPGATGADASGCLAAKGGTSTLQMGEVVNTLYANLTIPVVFPKPFTTVPNVTTATNDYYYWFGCSSAGFSSGAKVTSVTTAGFNMVITGSSDGCNKKQFRKVTWMAWQ